MNRSVASLFSCGYNCGTTEHYNPVTSTQSTTMRHSAARRSDNFQSPPIRSRSAERYSATAKVDDTLSPKSQDDLEFERASLRRATSDLYDSQLDADSQQYVVNESVTANETLSTQSESSHYFPTLPRFPVAESHNRNCWSEPPIAIFSVRGRSYFTDKKKVGSGPYLFPARGSDIFLTDSTDAIDLSKM
jgi:Protein ENHANCED DISEASE RESISTANCE 2, C-terminal